MITFEDMENDTMVVKLDKEAFTVFISQNGIESEEIEKTFKQIFNINKILKGKETI